MELVIATAPCRIKHARSKKKNYYSAMLNKRYLKSGYDLLQRHLKEKLKHSQMSKAANISHKTLSAHKLQLLTGIKLFNGVNRRKFKTSVRLSLNLFISNLFTQVDFRCSETIAIFYKLMSNEFMTRKG